MPFGTYATPKLPTIPTFLQYVKTCGKGVEGKTKFQVEVIWLPGKFDNLTLQTHAFRYVCSPDHPLYTEMQEYLKLQSEEKDSPRVDVVISSLENKEIDLAENSKVRGTWEKLGANAYKFKSP
jgi:hypothetical protein